MSLPETFQAVVLQASGEKPKISDVPLTQPGNNQVLVKIEYAVIHPADKMILDGSYPLVPNQSYRIGFEGFGIVVAVGEELKIALQVGDRVNFSGPGSWGQYILINPALCRKVADDVPAEEASCYFANQATIVCLAKMVQKGNHKAAIHTSGSSATGRMMIRYFKHKGIKLINVVRKDEYIAELEKEGADYVLNSQAPDFETRLKEIAAKESATISFEAVAGDLTRKIIANQPDDSTCYLYGALESNKLKDFGVADFIFQGKTLTGMWLGKYFAKNLNELGEISKEVETHALTLFKCPLQKVFKLTEFEQALVLYENESSKGKILLRPH